MSKIKLILLLSFFVSEICSAQDESGRGKRIRPFIAYELGEAAFNKFQSFSGEIGLKLRNRQIIRLTHMNVKLTEAHLSSSFAGAVDGNGVEGKLFGFEAFYDFPVFYQGLYVGSSIGYYVNEYNDINSDEKLESNSTTLGIGISYSETNVFKLEGLYFRLSIPFRMPLNPIEETVLGEAIIRDNTFDQNIWFFVGYEF